MSTDNHLFPTVDQMMQAITLPYSPLYTIFPAQAHEGKIENLKFTTVRAEDDIVARTINAQDTEREHIKVGEGSKFYAKFFKGLQYAENKRNARSALPGVNDKIIKAFHKQLDAEIWNGTDNNGVKISADPNHITNAAAELPRIIDGNNGVDALIARGLDLRKQVEKTSSASSFQLLFYGDELTKYLRKTLPNGTPYIATLREALPSVQLVDVPANLESANNGIVVVCPQVVQLNHTDLPRIENTGVDERAGEVWVNYIYGTAMLDVKEYGGVIVQPITIS